MYIRLFCNNKLLILWPVNEEEHISPSPFLFNGEKPLAHHRWLCLGVAIPIDLAGSTPFFISLWSDRVH